MEVTGRQAHIVALQVTPAQVIVLPAEAVRQVTVPAVPPQGRVAAVSEAVAAALEVVSVAVAAVALAAAVAADSEAADNLQVRYLSI